MHPPWGLASKGRRQAATNAPGSKAPCDSAGDPARRISMRRGEAQCSAAPDLKGALQVGRRQSGCDGAGRARAPSLPPLPPGEGRVRALSSRRTAVWPFSAFRLNESNEAQSRARPFADSRPSGSILSKGANLATLAHYSSAALCPLSSVVYPPPAILAILGHLRLPGVGQLWCFGDLGGSTAFFP
jgi:hypothetical protein